MFSCFDFLIVFQHHLIWYKSVLRWKPYGGRQTENSCTFSSETDRNEIATAKAKFSVLPVTMDLSLTTADIDQHQNFKMATAKLEVIVIFFYNR